MIDKTLQKIQIFYELAMAVGISLDLHQMLKHALFSYLRKLNCVCAVVYRVTPNRKKKYHNNLVFSIPFSPYIKKTYGEILEQIPCKFSEIDLLKYRNTLPLIDSTGKLQYYHIMLLDNFGFLVLIKNNKQLDTDIILALKEINVKLAQACEACIKNKELSESEERYKSMFYSNKSIMLLIDPENGNIIDANDAAIKFYKYARTKIKSMHIGEINKLSQKDLKRALQQASSGTKSSFIFQHKLANGEIKDVQVHCSKLFHKGKAMLYSIIYDITKQLKTERELITAKEKAEESDKLKSAFLTNMSHEIRTPMNSIIGFSSLFVKEDLNEKKRKIYASTIIKSGHQLLNLVNDILDISLIETGKLELNFEDIVVNDILLELYNTYSIQHNDKNISFYMYKGLKDAESTILTDSTRLVQVLSNLLNNAFKFTPKGHIKFGYTLKDKNLQFFVEDTGIGISAELHHKIFEQFRQAELGLTRQYGGTGLGLAISKNLVNLLGGDIWIKSQKKKGSTFYFTIPYKKSKTQIKKIESPSLNKENKEYIILVVEDEASNFLFLDEILAHKNISLIHAKDGLEAVEICKSNKRIDLVLMDIKMPKMNGYEATGIIKKENPSLPILAQTAYAMKEDEVKALEAGCDGYISKPIEEEKLLILIEKHRPITK